MLGMLASAPVFSMRVIPTRTKVGFAFLVALCAQASLVGQPLIGFNDPRALATLVHEMMIGLAIGFAVRMIFSSVELAGELMGLQMGLNFAMFFDPTSNGQVSAVSRFFGNIATLLFIVVNGHLMVLMAVVKSFETFPVNYGILNAYDKLKLFHMGTELFASALWIALPLIGMLLLVNLTMGIVSRIAPQMNIYAVGFPITLAVGLIGIAGGLPLLESPMATLMTHAINLFAAR